MKKAEAIKNVKIGRTLTTILKKDETGGFLTEAERNWVVCARMSVVELMNGEYEKYKESAELAALQIERINRPLSDEDLKKGFEKDETETGSADIPGQGRLDEEEEEDEEEEASQVDVSPSWSINPQVPVGVQKGLLQSVLDGAGRSLAITNVATAAGLSKKEIEAHWETLIRNGLLFKENGRWRSGLADVQDAPTEAEAVAG